MLVLQQIDGLSCCWVHSHHTTKSAAAKFLVTLLGPHRCSSSCSSVQPVTQALQYIVYIYSQFCTISYGWSGSSQRRPTEKFSLSLSLRRKKSLGGSSSSVQLAAAAFQNLEKRRWRTTPAHQHALDVLGQQGAAAAAKRDEIRPRCSLFHAPLQYQQLVEALPTTTTSTSVLYVVPPPLQYYSIVHCVVFLVVDSERDRDDCLHARQAVSTDALTCVW